MAAAAKPILAGSQSADGDVPSDALAMLMREAGTARREAARSILEPVIGTESWQQLKISVERELTSYAAASIEVVHPRLLMIAEATVRMLPSQQARDEYRAAFENIEGDAERWCMFAHIRYVAPCVHRVMSWDAVCFLGKAGLSASAIAVVVTGRELVRQTPQAGAHAPAARSAPRRAATPVAKPAQSFTDRWHSFLAARREAPAQEQPAKGERVATNSATHVEPPLADHAAPPSPAGFAPSNGDTIEPSIPLDARALHGSVSGTWLMLVGLSWVSIACAASGLAGVFLVPLWGTVWGFFGMGRARDATLSDMQFEPVDADSPIARSAARLAGALDIPTPRLGLIKPNNAFAMGRRVDDATIAIGDPLVNTLSARQVDAIIGHELGHIASGDMRRMMLMRTYQNATAFCAVTVRAKQFVRWGVFFLTELYILSFSRKREYWADAIGAALTSKEAMIGALKALDGMPPVTDVERLHARFMFRGPVSTWFSTHPPTHARIAALEAETYIQRLPRLRS